MIASGADYLSAPSFFTFSRSESLPKSDFRLSLSRGRGRRVLAPDLFGRRI
jgi:hypothetical protein